MFIDSHCHLDFCCFSDQLAALLEQLSESKITKLVIPGTQASRWDNIVHLSACHSPLYYALGIHPHCLTSFKPQDLAQLTMKLSTRSKKCIALGEIGLDKFAVADEALQESVFLEQLAIAEQFELPIILHCVKKQGRVLTLLKQQKFSRGGVYHAFSGSVEVAKEFIKLGFKLGVGGLITYPNATKTRETIAQLPLASLVLETDAPDMALYQQVDTINTPLNIITIFNVLSELRNESKAQLATQLYTNVCNIFPLSDD